MLAYLSRYTHRVAISNRRLIAVDQRSVTFKVKDYRIEGPGRYTTMTLDVGEFIRRFLIHVLPKGFHRIRHYGLFASANRAETIAWARELLGLAAPVAEEAVEIDPAVAQALALALPLLRRPHVRHRDLRGGLPTPPPADGNGVRYLMSETETFRTRITKGFPRWSTTRCAADRPNTCPALHSAPRASPKRIADGTQSKPIGPNLRAKQRHRAPPTSAHPQPSNQISIARGRRPTQPHARSFTGGFRTTAPVQAELSRWAVIRNPSTCDISSK